MALIKIDKVELDEDLIRLIKEPETQKVLATKDKKGNVHVVFKGSIDINENGNIIVYEILESSQTNRNLTYSLWFNQHVAVTVRGKDGTSYQIKGIPYKDHSTGPYFEEKYRELIEKRPELDISGIWEIIPDEVRLETLIPRLEEEREKYPILGHADKDFIG